MPFHLSSWSDIFKDKPPGLVEYYYKELTSRKEVSEQTKVVLEFDLSDFREIKGITDSDLIIINHNGDFYLCTYDYQRIGKLIGPNVDRLASINRTDFDLIVEDFDRKAGKISINILLRT